MSSLEHFFVFYSGIKFISKEIYLKQKTLKKSQHNEQNFVDIISLKSSTSVLV
jgi:hypothetical protein